MVDNGIRENNYQLIDDYEKDRAKGQRRKDYLDNLAKDDSIRVDAIVLYRSFKKTLTHSGLTTKERKTIAKRCCYIHIKNVIEELRKQVPVSSPNFNNIRIITYWKGIKKQVKSI